MLSKLKFGLVAAGLALFASVGAHAATWSLTPGTAGTEVKTIGNMTLGLGVGTNDGSLYSTSYGTPDGNKGDTGKLTTGGSLCDSGCAQAVTSAQDFYYWGLEVLPTADGQKVAFALDPLSFDIAYWNTPDPLHFRIASAITADGSGGVTSLDTVESYLPSGTVGTPGSVYVYFLDPGYYLFELKADCKSAAEGPQNCDTGSTQVGFTLTAVPVPPAMLLFASGLVGLAAAGRRRLKTRAAA